MGRRYRSADLLPALALAALAGAAGGAWKPTPECAAAGLGAAGLAALAWLAQPACACVAGVAAAAGLAFAGAATAALPYAAAAPLDGRIVAARYVVLGVPEAEASGGASAPVRIERLDGRSFGPLRGTARFPAGEAPRLADEAVGPALVLVRRSGLLIYPRGVLIVGRRPQPIRDAFARIRAALADGLRRALRGAPGTEWAVAMTLGPRGGIGAAEAADFRRSGATHLLAISGFNVGIVGGAALGLAGRLGLRRRPASLVAAAVVVGYAALAGASPSVVRATAMGLGILAGRILGRPQPPLRALCAAACATLAVDPFSVADPGFQLSYAAAASILHIAPSFRAERRGVMADLFVVSVTAQAATAPLTALHFGQVSLVGVVSNLVLVPLFGLLVPAALLIALLSVPSPGAAEAAGALLAPALAVAGGAIRAAAAVPFAAIPSPPPGPLVLAAWTSLLALLPAAVSGARVVPSWAARLAALSLAVLLAVRGGATFAAIDDGRLRVLCLEGAALLHARNGERTLLLGEAAPSLVVGPLQRRGLLRLDRVVVAGRLERARALDEILAAFDVRRIALRPPPPGPGAAALIEAGRRARFRVEPLAQGRIVLASGPTDAVVLAARGAAVAVVAAEGPRTIRLGPNIAGLPRVEAACGPAPSGDGPAPRRLRPGEEAVVDTPGGPWRFSFGGT